MAVTTKRLPSLGVIEARLHMLYGERKTAERLLQKRQQQYDEVQAEINKYEEYREQKTAKGQ
ncbi:hypothetical protein B1A87_005290 [Arthrobacter sp. KBS0703]|uniref:hypothetical protein n=1 Tax=Arthrobacter sp. KBS0703 TaxID=1955698 RepID=UPI00098FBC6C|nr:hypothetical protein [Arthrobacter sp. KBS0703]TSE15411.1 hypothetical protein B1A87_005290 [Arthrobacter sp. KBS0703]